MAQNGPKMAHNVQKMEFYGNIGYFNHFFINAYINMKLRPQEGGV